MAVRNAFTVDLEDWYHGIELPRERWEQCEDRLAVGTGRLLALLAERGVRATFFVLGVVAKRSPDLIRQIADAGHEIGTHGWSHQFVYKLTPEQFTAELRDAVAAVEDASGCRVRGHRAPYFSITRDSLWALDRLVAEGLQYDSSIFPVRNYRYGIEDAPREPYWVQSNGGRLLEIPMSTARLLGRNRPVSGGAYFRIYPYWLTRALMRRCNAAGQAVVFYLHPWELDPLHPRLDLPRRVALTHYANLGATEPRLRRLLRDFEFGPLETIVDEAGHGSST
jgi:polysaccharide deacetylase family protein (PEP-CTERM system associated)